MSDWYSSLFGGGNWGGGETPINMFGSHGPNTPVPTFQGTGGGGLFSGGIPAWTLFNAGAALYDNAPMSQVGQAAMQGMQFDKKTASEQAMKKFMANIPRNADGTVDMTKAAARASELGDPKLLLEFWSKAQEADKAAQDKLYRNIPSGGRPAAGGGMEAIPGYGDFERMQTRAKELPQLHDVEDASGNKIPMLVNRGAGTAAAVPLPGVSQQGQNPFQTGKMTEAEGKSALFADRAMSAHKVVTKHEKINTDASGFMGGALERVVPTGAMNVVASKERGEFMNAKRAFMNALLRRESGAAINAGEFASYDQEYFPQPGEGKEIIDQKRSHREEVIRGLAREAGKGYKPGFGPDDLKGKSAEAGKPAEADPMAVQRKTVGGQKFIKIQGTWYYDK